MHHSDVSSVLNEFIAACEHREMPQRVLDAFAKTAQGYEWFQRSLSEGQLSNIYGVNTQPGHRDNVHLSLEEAAGLSGEIIQNHCLPYDKSFPDELGKYVTLAKCYSTAAGGSLVSPEAFQVLCDVFEDSGVTIHVPRNSSYSSGDVIPASHWVSQFLSTTGYQLKPGEGMALINGAFVHLGTSAYVVTQLNRFWRMFLASTQKLFTQVNVDQNMFDFPHCDSRCHTIRAVEFVTENARSPTEQQPQPYVSIRSTPQIMDGFLATSGQFAKEIGYYLFKPSGNPQIGMSETGAYRISSSGSFVVPSVALAAGAVLDSLLMLGWHIVRRTEFFLSGSVSGIPLDASTQDAPLGLIQWPKLMTAKLERMRSTYGASVFSSGGATSYGVEDFWTRGVSTNENILDALEALTEILCLEFAVLSYFRTPGSVDLHVARTDLESLVSGMPEALIAT